MKVILDEKPIDKGIETKILVYESENRELIGFVELSLRKNLEEFDTSPIGYLEGWYVQQDYRQKGIGRELVKEAEKWAVEKGCTEMASDVEKHNEISKEAHKKLDFIEYGVNDVEILFRKLIKV